MTRLRYGHKRLWVVAACCCDVHGITTPRVFDVSADPREFDVPLDAPQTKQRIEPGLIHAYLPTTAPTEYNALEAELEVVGNRKTAITVPGEDDDLNDTPGSDPPVLRTRMPTASPTKLGYGFVAGWDGSNSRASKRAEAKLVPLIPLHRDWSKYKKRAWHVGGSATYSPTLAPTAPPTEALPTPAPTLQPTPLPTPQPTKPNATASPIQYPTGSPVTSPTSAPTPLPTQSPILQASDFLYPTAADAKLFTATVRIRMALAGFSVATFNSQGQLAVRGSFAAIFGLNQAFCNVTEMADWAPATHARRRLVGQSSYVLAEAVTFILVLKTTPGNAVAVCAKSDNIASSGSLKETLGDAITMELQSHQDGETNEIQVEEMGLARLHRAPTATPTASPTSRPTRPPTPSPTKPPTRVNHGFPVAAPGQCSPLPGFLNDTNIPGGGTERF